MVESYRRKKHKQKLLGNHQKCWIWGRHVVLETLQAGRWPILELVVEETLPGDELRFVQELAAAKAVALRMESAAGMQALCKSREHQGYLAKMPPFPYADGEDVFRQSASPPLFAVLDAIQDPYNFGAIVRSAAGLGVDACFVARTGQVEVTSLVARASAGAVNLVPIVQVEDLVECGRELQQRGIRLVGAAAGAASSASEYDFRTGTALVIGNEGAGIRPELLALCDAVVAIPQQGRLDSLNAAVSAGILFYEARRQRLAAADSSRKDNVGARTS